MKEESASLALAQTHPHFSDNAKIMLEAEQSVIDDLQAQITAQEVVVADAAAKAAAGP